MYFFHLAFNFKVYSLLNRLLNQLLRLSPASLLFLDSMAGLVFSVAGGPPPPPSLIGAACAACFGGGGAMPFCEGMPWAGGGGPCAYSSIMGPLPNPLNPYCEPISCCGGCTGIPLSMELFSLLLGSFEYGPSLWLPFEPLVFTVSRDCW